MRGRKEICCIIKGWEEKEMKKMREKEEKEDREREKK